MKKERLPREKFNEILFDALCNGLCEFEMPLDLIYDDDEYDEANQIIREEKGKDYAICYEEVVFKMLTMGKTLKVIDRESDEEYIFTLYSMYENSIKINDSLLEELENEWGDALTYDAFLQICILGEIVYG